MAVNYSDLYDRILGKLTALKNAGKGKLVSLNDVLSLIKPDSETSEVIQLAKYLEADGDIQADYKLGQVFVSILPKGIMKWESSLYRLDSGENEDIDLNKIKDINEIKVQDFRAEAIKIIQKMYNKAKDLEYINPDIKVELQIVLLELNKMDADVDLILQKLNRVGQSLNAAKDIAEFKDKLALID